MVGHERIPSPYEGERGGLTQVRVQPGPDKMSDSGVGCTETVRPALTTWLKSCLRKKLKKKSTIVLCYRQGPFLNKMFHLFFGTWKYSLSSDELPTVSGKTEPRKHEFPQLPLLISSYLYPIHLHSDSLKPASFCLRLFIYLS